MTEFSKTYNPSLVEKNIYSAWESSGLFSPKPGKTGKTFSIAMPPPNITGILHTGHAITLSVEDLMIRYHRMLGDETLWIPGTDHAAIATQSVVEKKILKEEGKTRHDFTREELLDRIREFVSHTQSRIQTQIREMGASCDWSREKYTFSDEMNKSVNEIFVQMYNDGLIYRGNRIVNWDPKLQTTVSDDEIEHVDRPAKFYYIKYGPFVVATSRPETKLGDTGLAVHPDDKRYTKYHGKMLDIELAGHKITVKVVADKEANPEVGTGVIGLTPAHSQIDFEIGQKNDLKIISVIGEDAKMTKNAGKYAGQTVLECRENFVADLEKAGQIEKIEDYTQSVSLSDRGKVPVEPLISKQWFIDVNKELKHKVTGKKTTLKKMMQDAVRSGDIEIIPARFEKTYFHWIDNLRDWCISRQIIWGHQIPVWTCECGEVIVDSKEPSSCSKCGEKNKKPLAIIVHGKPQTDKRKNVDYIPSNKKHWLPWLQKELEKRGYEVVNRLMPVAHDPKYKDWKETLSDVVDRIDEQTIVVGTSAGGAFVTRWLSEMQKNIKHLILVAPVMYKDGDEYKETSKDVCYFSAESVNTKKLAKIITMFGAHEDSFSKFFPKYEKLFDIKCNWLDGRGHFITKHHKLNTQFSEITDILGEPISSTLTQDPDTLDTWFSSGLWTFSTLGWPNMDSEDLKKFHPTSVLETGYDILFFWVAKMIMMSEYALGEPPFKQVYLHGLVRDEHKQKMSKSLGNVLDPIILIDKYGTDALRMALLVGSAPGNDMALSEQKISGYRNFANKLWNIARFILEKNETSTNTPNTLAEKWIASRLQTVIREATEDLNKLRFSSAGEKLYAFVWDEFADWFIECQKIDSTPGFSRSLLTSILKLLHPFMPFITEAIWRIEDGNWRLEKEEFIMVSSWPETNEKLINEKSEKDFEIIRNLIVAIRSKRSEMKVDPAKKVKAFFTDNKTIEKNEPILKQLARLSELAKVDKKPEEQCLEIENIYIPLSELIDPEKEKTRLKTELEKLDKYISGIEKKLADKKFSANAPEKVITHEKEKLKEAQEKLKTTEDSLSKL